MKMEGFKTFRYYQALKLHFTDPKYDVFKMQGRVKCSREKFESRRDKLLFERLGKQFTTDQDCIQWIAANFLYKNPNMVYGQDEADKFYKEYQRRKQSITKIFEYDLNDIIKYNARYTTKSLQTLPDVIQLWLSGRITTETVIILNSIDHIIDRIKEDVPVINTMIGDDLLILEKGAKFVKYNPDKILPIYQQFIEEVLK